MTTNSCSCRDMEKRVEALLNRELPPDEESLCREHLSRCPSCQKRFQGDFHVDKILENYFEKESPSSLPAFDFVRFNQQAAQTKLAPKSASIPNENEFPIRGSPSPQPSPQEGEGDHRKPKAFGYKTLLQNNSAFFLKIAALLLLGVSLYFVFYPSLLSVKPGHLSSLPPVSLGKESEVAGGSAEKSVTVYRPPSVIARSTATQQSPEAGLLRFARNDSQSGTGDKRVEKSLLADEAGRLAKKTSSEQMMGATGKKSYFLKAESQTMEEKSEATGLVVSQEKLSSPASLLASGSLRAPFDNELQSVSLSISGKASAPVELIEFMDPWCTYCIRIHRVIRRVLKTLRMKFRDAISYRLVLFPLVTIHGEGASLASEAILAAAAQGKAEAMIEALWNEKDLQKKTTKELSNLLILLAKQAQVPDITAFSHSLQTHQFKSQLQKHIHLASSLNVSGVPILLLESTASKKVFEYKGPQKSQDLSRAIEFLLEKQKEKGK